MKSAAFTLLCLGIMHFVSPEDLFSAHLDCVRVSPAFCCTSRVRESCPGMCASIACGPSFYLGMFSTDEEARDGSVAVDHHAKHVAPSTSTMFPTLVTSASEVVTQQPETTHSSQFIHDSSAEAQKIEINPTTPKTFESSPTTTVFAEAATITPMKLKPTKKPRIRITPDPRIIPPPGSELAFITDYDDYDFDEGSTPEPATTTTTTTEPSTPSESELFLHHRSQFMHGLTPPIATRFVLKPAFVDSSAFEAFEQPRNELTTTLMPSFSKALEPLVDKLLSALPAELINSKPTATISTRHRTPKHGDAPDLIGRLELNTPAPARTTVASSFSFKLVRRQPTRELDGGQTMPNGCGRAPNYLPCVPSDKAAQKLAACLQAKSLPSGCQKLARYNVTQDEVRGALHRGECGLLHIAPFLECASAGHNNTQCCKDKQVHLKSGPQCLQFCGRPSTPPGIQHLACASVMQLMLQCHHAGLTL